MGLKGITINTSAAEEPHILAEDDAAIYQAVFGGDCVFDIGNRMKATVLSNNKVRVGDGVICVGGHVARNIYGDYEELVIENGTSGMKRNDLIVAKFTSTGPGGVDTFSLEVKKGTSGTAASDPVVTKGNLYEGASLREFPLYRVKIEGLSITAVEQLFKVRKTNEQLENEVTELNGKFPTEETKYTSFDVSTISSGVKTQLKSWTLTKDQIVTLHGELKLMNDGATGEMCYQRTYINGDVVAGFSAYHTKSGVWNFPFSQAFPAKEGDVVKFEIQVYVPITSLSGSVVYANL